MFRSHCLSLVALHPYGRHLWQTVTEAASFFLAAAVLGAACRTERRTRSCPLRDSLDIRAAAGGRPELVELPGADHIVSGKGTPAMTRAVVRFVAAQLEA
jgi:hypothetical protein